MTKIYIFAFFYIYAIHVTVFGDKSRTQAFLEKFQQNDYEFKFERSEVVSYNKTLADYINVSTFKYNRTSALMNISMQYKVDVGYDLEVMVQAYTFLSNEFRFFPMRFEVNLCDAFNQNVAGLGEWVKCGNFSSCPFQKNKLYTMCNWSPDASKFPPFIPNGQYMVEFQTTYHSMEVSFMRSYGTIDRPIPIP